MLDLDERYFAVDCETCGYLDFLGTTRYKGLFLCENCLEKIYQEEQENIELKID
jgi:hypothetical protein